MSLKDFIALEKLGQVRLSRHFWMRQFLHSEIAMIYRIPNVPDFPDVAIEAGTYLCRYVLEPLVEHFGPIVVRSGFRSARLNAFGAENGLRCASNAQNFAGHIWDHRDDEGRLGATACVVIPALVDQSRDTRSFNASVRWIEHEVSYHRIHFFKNAYAFNINWAEGVPGER